MRLPRRPHMPGYQKSAPGSGPADPALAPNREPSAAGHGWKGGARERARNGRQAVSSKRTLCRRGCFPSLESSPPAGGISPGHRFRTCTSGPVWDRPLRRGIKPERRADIIRPYGRNVIRYPAGAQCAPLQTYGEADAHGGAGFTYKKRCTALFRAAHRFSAASGGIKTDDCSADSA